MENFFNFQLQIEGLLIVSAILLGGFFLFSDNIGFFENVSNQKDQFPNSESDNSVSSAKGFGSYFKEFFSFAISILFGGIISKDNYQSPNQSNGKSALLKLAISIPLLVLLLSITGNVGKSISNHWMNQQNGFHFGFKNFWADSCSFSDVVKKIQSSGIDTLQKDTNKLYVFGKGLLTKGVMIEDNNIKLNSFDILFPIYKKNGIYKITDTTYIETLKNDTLKREHRTFISFFSAKENKKGNQNLLIDNDSHIKTVKNPFKDSLIKTTIVNQSYFKINSRAKIELYHAAKNFFLKNADTNKEITTKISEKSSIINFSRTLALAFYLMFLLSFTNLIIHICRAINKLKNFVFISILVLFAILFISHKYYLVNLFTVLAFVIGLLVYFKYLYARRKGKIENLPKLRAYRLSILLALSISLFSLAGYLTACVNWKYRENDNNVFILGNFKSVVLQNKKENNIHPKIIKILLPVSIPGAGIEANYKYTY